MCGDWDGDQAADGLGGGTLVCRADSCLVTRGRHSTLITQHPNQGGFDGRGQPTASPMLTAIMSGGVGISGRELYKYR